MQQVELTQINISETKQNKKGRDYKMVFIEWEGGKASMYCDLEWQADHLKEVEGWEYGDKVDIVVETKGEYTNFRLPKKEDLLESRVTSLEEEVIKLKKIIKRLAS